MGSPGRGDVDTGRRKARLHHAYQCVQGLQTGAGTPRASRADHVAVAEDGFNLQLAGCLEIRCRTGLVRGHLGGAAQGVLNDGLS